MVISFEPGVVMVSVDTEQIWGYHDRLNEAQFESRFPNAAAAHTALLDRLCRAGVRATWFVVGSLALGKGGGSLWHCRPFLEDLRTAHPVQEIGLHGGLTHLVWTDTRSTLDAARHELTEGIQALTDLCGRPASFSFPRNAEAYHELLPQHGLRSFRGRPQTLAWRLGPTVPGAILRAWEEIARSTPPPVWPERALPDLWNIPSSTFFYPIRPARSRVIGLRSRVERFRRGVETAARYRAIFHFSLHPENLAESPDGFLVLDEILEALAGARDRGDVEILTMSDVVARMERNQPYDCQTNQ